MDLPCSCHFDLVDMEGDVVDVKAKRFNIVLLSAYSLLLIQFA